MKKSSTLLYLVNGYQSTDYSTEKQSGALEQKLTGMDKEPSAKVIKNILDFACVYDVVSTRSAGDVEMILN